MSTKPLTLEGLVPKKSRDEDGDGILHDMRRENQRLESELRQVRAELVEIKATSENAHRVIRNLRDQLNPLHRALRAVFGEIELIVTDADFTETQTPGASASQPNGGDPRWESFKQSFPGIPARIIDALLAHREKTITQLSALLRAHYNTIRDACGVLLKAGAITKDGRKGAYRLNA